MRLKFNPNTNYYVNIMIDFVEKNEDFTPCCSGVFISLPIARLLVSAIGRYLRNHQSVCDSEVLHEFGLCVREKVKFDDLFHDE